MPTQSAAAHRRDDYFSGQGMLTVLNAGGGVSPPGTLLIVR